MSKQYTSADLSVLDQQSTSAEIKRLGMRVAELERHIMDVERWQQAGEALMLQPNNLRVIFRLGSWWADRPWRAK